MADSQDDWFQQAATTHVRGYDRAPGRNRLCSLSKEAALRTATKTKWIDPGRTGDGLKDPVSADFTRASYPEVV